MLRVEGIRLEEKGHVALHDISFGQAQFQRLALAGETGAGKSSLLQIIAGLIQPTAGQVRFEDQRVKGPQDQLIPGHPGIAYLSQHFELPRFLRVEQVLRYANQLPAGAAETLYEVCRIGPLLGRRTDQLSGGERQRIALARLLLASPRLLLLDEPYSNLDRGHRNILKAVIQDLGEQLGITCLLISHDPADTLSWAEEILVLQQGRLVQQGAPEQIYQQPVNEYVAGLFGDYNLVSGALLKALNGSGGRRGQQRLLRPEKLRLEAGGAEAQVRAVRYLGSSYEVEVEAHGHRLRLRAAVPPGVGDTVGVRVAEGERAWYL